jgi:hypothetical protein
MTENTPSLPYGKYLNPNTIGAMKILAHKTINEMEPESLYLTQDTKDGTIYCWYENCGPGGGSSEDPEAVMTEFIKETYGHGFKLEVLTPKSENWFISYYAARVQLDS